MPRVKSDIEKHPRDYFTGADVHPKDRIIIHESRDIPREGIFVSLNGYSYLIKPEMEVDIPRPLRKMLDTRITTITTQDEDNREYKKDVRRINYTLIASDVNGVAENKGNNIEETVSDG